MGDSSHKKNDFSHQSAKEILDDLGLSGGSSGDLLALNNIGVKVQAHFDRVFGTEHNNSEISMVDKKDKLADFEDVEAFEEEDMATLVLDLNELKKEMEESPAEVIEDVEIDFGVTTSEDIGLEDQLEELSEESEIGLESKGADFSRTMELSEEEQHDRNLSKAVDEGEEEFSFEATLSEIDIPLPAPGELELDVGGSGDLQLSEGDEDLPSTDGENAGLKDLDLSDSGMELAEETFEENQSFVIENEASEEEVGEASFVVESSEEEDVDLGFAASNTEDVNTGDVSGLMPSSSDLEYPDEGATVVIGDGDKSFEEELFANRDQKVEEEVVFREERVPQVSADMLADHKEYVRHHENELDKLRATLGHIRNDREELLSQNSSLSEEKRLLEQHIISLRGEKDEISIELSLLKKRLSDDVEALKYQLELSEDKRKMAEEKVKMYKSEFDRLNQKVRVDFKKIQVREKELENQLELLKNDTDVQIRNRDSKILELKRKIDSLEFDIENMGVVEEKSREDNFLLEDKIDKAKSTLRMALKMLEEDEAFSKLDIVTKLKEKLEM